MTITPAATFGMLCFVFVAAIVTGIVSGVNETSTKHKISDFFAGFMLIYIGITGIFLALTRRNHVPFLLSILAIWSFFGLGHDAMYITALVWNYYILVPRISQIQQDGFRVDMLWDCLSGFLLISTGIMSL